MKRTSIIRSTTPEDIAIKWTKELSSENIAMIETLCWKTMLLLGYANYSNQETISDIMLKNQKDVWQFP